MKKFKKILKYILLGIFVLLLVFAGYLFIGKPPIAKDIIWGVNFSQKHASLLGLDWQETYLALLDDLEVKNLKVAAHWDSIEPEDGNFNFGDLDWQIEEAEKREAQILLAIGMKTPRWPECHTPNWAKNLTKDQQQKKILRMLEKIVNRYKNSETIKYWQIENEPFFPFGECPWVDKVFLKKEIELVKSIDRLKRPVIISDSGEGSLWITAARFGDIIGTTMYKKVWFTLPNFLKKNLGGFRQIGMYIHYPFPPTFYWRKAQIIKKIFGKEVIVIELQAEPWGKKLLYDSPIEEQQKTMNPTQFKENIEFAKRTGFKEFYLWGAEWWFWMKSVQNNSQIWDEARNLFLTQEQ
ncbi:MAG TPA: hypothetical protein ENI19_01965 [Candidatus Nealsonbacteria bacterium]|uniref:Glycoside hydrolase family 42 N-terminal domain-containing protein n=1 Tax=marine sediment metagenome TaxID=412755 RepID=A0A0F9XMU0_9ZZZZ|nr:hypothetical protein [Candidatus Nealsonbacteria bacterium]HEB46457.1 hypothetical protein [Candidatus Nealsonbacteria bacterium]